MLPAQPNLRYLFCSPGYLFPRHDAVVVGGTEETTFKDDKPDLRICRQVLHHVRRPFEPTLVTKLMPNAFKEYLRPSWLIQNKEIERCFLASNCCAQIAAFACHVIHASAFRSVATRSDELSTTRMIILLNQAARQR
jgi:hypothetical protein